MKPSRIIAWAFFLGCWFFNIYDLFLGPRFYVELGQAIVFNALGILGAIEILYYGGEKDD